MIETDLRCDGVKQRVVFDPRDARTVSVWQGHKLLWRGVPKSLRPWKLVLADVDGNGSKELLVGVRKKSRRIRMLHNTLFVYGFDGRTVHKRWLGSTLGREFSDFAFDASGKLYTVESRRDGRKCAGIYAWRGFGFAKLTERGSWRKARLTGLRDGVMTVLGDGKLTPIAEEKK